MKHRFLALAAAAAILTAASLSSVNAFAASGTVEGILNWEITDDEQITIDMIDNDASLTVKGNVCAVSGKDLTVVETYTANELMSKVLDDPDNMQLVDAIGELNINKVVFTDNVEHVANINFGMSLFKEIESITFGKSVKTIKKDSFAMCPKIKDITVLSADTKLENTGLGYTKDNKKIENVTIHGYSGSTAQNYAESNGFNFDVIRNVMLGDTDKNNTVDALDASMVLMEYARIATSRPSSFDEDQSAAADVNKDGAIDALDASDILRYYAYKATGGTDSMETFMA